MSSLTRPLQVPNYCIPSVEDITRQLRVPHVRYGAGLYFDLVVDLLLQWREHPLNLSDDNGWCKISKGLLNMEINACTMHVHCKCM